MVSRLIRRYFTELSYLTSALEVDKLVELIERVAAAHARGATVFTFGNGGSAATASHFACDLMKYARDSRGRSLRALSLSDAVPIMTATANDFAYERIFSEQLAVHARPGDVVIAISGSGNSPNVVQAVELANQLDLTTIAVTGFGGGKLARMADLAVVVPGSNMQVVEDVHASICHITSLGLAATLGGGTESDRRVRRPAVFLDRDGVVNVRRLDHVKELSELDLAPGAIEALRALGDLDLPVAIVTNQSVIGRGLASRGDVDAIHARIQSEVLAAGGPELRFYVCPHAPHESCHCRKPRPGLLLRAARELDIDLESSVFVGDSMTDVGAALSAGCHPILIGDAPTVVAGWPADVITVVASFADAVEAIGRRVAYADLTAATSASTNGIHA
jgi:D-sedoheptulose 7-phosphate isomerase